MLVSPVASGSSANMLFPALRLCRLCRDERARDIHLLGVFEVQEHCWSTRPRPFLMEDVQQVSERRKTVGPLYQV